MAGFLAGLAILAIIVAWQLSRGPVSLSYFTDHVARALTPADERFAVSVGDVQVVWAGWQQALDLQVTEVAVTGSDGRRLALIPAVSLGLSLRAMARGMIAPTRLELTAPHVRVVRAADGRYGFQVRVDPDAEGGEPDLVLSGLMDELKAPPDPSRPLGYLESFNIVDAHLTLDDRRRGVVWSTPKADIEIARTATGVAARVDAALRLEGRAATVNASLRFDRRNEVVDGDLHFAGARPSLLARTVPIPEFARLAELDDPVSGRVSATVAADGSLHSLRFVLESARFAMTGGARFSPGGDEYSAELEVQRFEGELLDVVLPELDRQASIAALLRGAAKITGSHSHGIGSVEFSLDAAEATLSLPELYTDLQVLTNVHVRGSASDGLASWRLASAGFTWAGAQLSLDGEATFTDEERRAEVRIALSGLDAKQLDAVWPESVQPNARSWILLNVTDGVVRDGVAQLSVDLPHDHGGVPQIAAAHGSLEASGLTIGYFHPLPPAVGVDAALTFTQDRIDVVFTGGHVDGIRLQDGTLALTDFDQEYEVANVEVLVRGPMRDAALLLDHPRLALIGKLGLDPNSFSGDVAARLKFRFPLSEDLEWEEVAFGASATAVDAGLDPDVLGLLLTGGELVLTATGNDLGVTGRGELNGVPVDLSWREWFGDGVPVRTVLSARGRLGEAERKALGLPPMRELAGTVPVAIEYNLADDGSSVVRGEIDLSQAAIDLNVIGLHKAQGVESAGSFVLNRSAAGEIRVEKLRVAAADGLDLEASIDLEPVGMGLRRADVVRLRFGANDLGGTVVADPAGGYRLALEGARVDVSPMLAPVPDSVSPPAQVPGPPVAVSARFDTVILGGGRVLGPTRATLRHDGSRLDTLAVDSSLGESRLNIRFEPKEGGGRELRAGADNAGAALQALGISERVNGGVLSLVGEQAEGTSAFTGRFRIERYNVSRVPALARLLQVLSLTGIFSAFNQQGLDFVLLDGQFRHYGGTLELLEARTFGSSIGITATGLVYADGEWADVRGTLVPAYTINQTLGRIPILGPLLTGGKNEGVFAAEYTVKGPLDDPTVAVNPLSALAPGFLRNLVSADVQPPPDRDASHSTQ